MVVSKLSSVPSGTCPGAGLFNPSDECVAPKI